jgi:hypothetical protein
VRRLIGTGSKLTPRLRLAVIAPVVLKALPICSAGSAFELLEHPVRQDLNPLTGKHAGRIDLRRLAVEVIACGALSHCIFSKADQSLAMAPAECPGTLTAKETLNANERRHIYLSVLREVRKLGPAYLTPFMRRSIVSRSGRVRGMVRPHRGVLELTDGLMALQVLLYAGSLIPLPDGDPLIATLNAEREKLMAVALGKLGRKADPACERCHTTSRRSRPIDSETLKGRSSAAVMVVSRLRPGRSTLQRYGPGRHPGPISTVEG